MLRKYKAWCPICLEAWRNNNQPIYEPLIWNFKLINICANHSTFLNTRCHLCGSEIPIFSRKSRNGYCSHCGCWLGSQNVRFTDKEPPQSSWDYYCSINIGDLLVNGARLPANHFKSAIEKLISTLGGANAFSRHFDISKSTVSEWRNAIHKPSLEIILRLFYSLGRNILDIRNLIPPVKNELEKNAQTKKQTVRRKIDWDNTKTALVDIISDCDTYAPSVREVARVLEIEKSSLYYHFPELCKEISNNHTSQVDLFKNSRLEDGYEKIKEAVSKAYNIGDYPSRRNVEKSLPSSIILREKAFKDFWKTLI